MKKSVIIASAAAFGSAGKHISDEDIYSPA